MKNVMLVVIGTAMMLGMVSAGRKDHEHFRRAKHLGRDGRDIEKRCGPEQECGKGAYGGVVSSKTFLISRILQV